MAPALTYTDSLRMHRYVGLPAVLGGLVAPSPRFWPGLTRRRSTAVGQQVLRSIRHKYGPRAWFWFPGGRTLIVLDGEGIGRVLEGSDTAADPWTKRRTLSRFTPQGAIISRGPLWTRRRKLNDDALAFGCQRHPDAQQFVDVVEQEVEGLLHQRRDVLAWDDFSSLAARISQQVIFGRGQFCPDFDRHLTRLVAASNFGWRRAGDYRPFLARIRAHVEGDRRFHPSLLCRSADQMRSLAADVEPSSQAAFWIFVLKDAIELHTVRTLALIANAAHDVQDKIDAELQQHTPLGSALRAAGVEGLRLVEACIKEQLRLWTPVPILLRVATNTFRLGRTQICEGEQILLHTGFYHRDPEVFGDGADAFEPLERLGDSGDRTSVTSSAPPLYFFSRHQQACAGQFLAVFVLKAVLAALLRHGRLVLGDRPIDTRHVPAAIDQFALRFWRRRRL